MEEDYSSEKDDQEEDYVEMYEPSLALLDIYMERLTLKDDDEDMEVVVQLLCFRHRYSLPQRLAIIP